MFFFPMINDVTTTPETPPAYVVLAQTAPNKGRDMGYPPGNVPVQRLAYPDLAPLARFEPPEACFAKAVAAAKAMERWEVVAEDPAARRLEAVATTRLFRWQDDVVVEVRPAPGGCAVHMRSKSRAGRGDFGANAKRIRAYLARLAKT
ncbi:DUF1499 domain-containing protein [bacterium]|nr:MAG: DUF1499 domain-containing protein [bacterium]